MALVSMRQLLDHAAEHGYGIPAFNVNNLEQVQAIMEAAAETDSPVIMQASAGARKYAGEGFLKHLIQAAVESYPHIPVVMHQDHGQSPKVCQGAIDLGFSSVMMDGSLKEDGKTIADYDYNVDVTKKVVDVAHKLGVTVEEIQEAIKYGVRKINIDTDIRLAMTGAIRRFFAENPEKFDPREYLKPARAAAKAICVARYTEFGTAGNASKIKALPLTEIAAQYAAGKLAQVVQ